MARKKTCDIRVVTHRTMTQEEQRKEQLRKAVQDFYKQLGREMEKITNEK